VPLSGSLGFLAVIHRRAETHFSLPFTACFPDFHAFTQLPSSSDDYELPFHALVRASWSLGESGCGIAPFRQLHLLRSFTPSCESVRNWIGFPLPGWPILSWAYAPLELSPLTPRILDPPKPRA
jgi:hypothetical protein